MIAEFADAQTQPSAHVPATVLDGEKKKLSRLEERREACVRAAAGGSSDRDNAEPQATVTGRRVLIGRDVCVDVLGAAGPARRGCLQRSGILESAGHRQRIPDDEHGHVSSRNAVSDVYRLVVPWDRCRENQG